MQHLITERPDTISHVADLARVTHTEHRATLIAAVRDQGLSRVQTRERVEAMLHPTAPRAEAEGQKQPYVQTYDGDTNHNDQRATPSVGAAPAPHGRGTLPEQEAHAAARGQLNGRERATLLNVATKISGWIEASVDLSADDWAALEPLARRLNDLLKARYQH